MCVEYGGVSKSLRKSERIELEERLRKDFQRDSIIREFPKLNLEIDYFQGGFAYEGKVKLDILIVYFMF